MFFLILRHSTQKKGTIKHIVLAIPRISFISAVLFSEMLVIVALLFTIMMMTFALLLLPFVIFRFGIQSGFVSAHVIENALSH